MALGALVLLLLIMSMTAKAEYDQSEADPEDDVLDRENKETTDEYPEVDLLYIVTTDNGDGTVTSVTTYKGDVALSGKYVYTVNLSDGEEESEHYVEYFLVPDNGINLIQYRNGEDENETEDALVADGTTLTAVIELSKCGIPEADFTITTCMSYTYGSSPYLDIKHSDELGEPPVYEGYETDVDVTDDGGDDHENDILVTVWYYEKDERREPVEGANVSLHYTFMNETVLGTGNTGANGQLLFGNLVPGEYMVMVEDDQYEEYTDMLYTEILMDDTPILKIRADEYDIDGDELYTDGKVWVYYGAYMEDTVHGAKIYMDNDYVGDSSAMGLEIEGPIPEGLHLIKAEYEGDVAYTCLNIETDMEENFSEEMHISEVDEPGDPHDDLENDIYVEFTDDDSSDPIAGVDIYLDGSLIGTTDANGSVIRKDLTEGYHEVTATYDGDDYFSYLLIGFSETHELGDFDFDGDKNDMKFTAEVAGLSLPYSTFFLRNDTRNGMPETFGFSSFNGVGYVQDLEAGDHHGGIVSMMAGIVQLEEFNFSVGAGEETVTEPQEVDFGDGNEATVQAGVAGDVTITSQAGSQPDSGDDDALGVYLEVTMDGDGLLGWVNVTIDYDDVPAGIDPAKLKMYYWDEGTEEWVLIENSGVDTVNKFVWANVTHLTLFAPRQQTGSGGNQAPVIEITNPKTGDTVSGVIDVAWTATDPDGDKMKFMVSISKDSGATWIELFGSMGYYLTIVDTYAFDTTNNSVGTPDGGTYRFKLEVFDDGDPARTSVYETGDFTIGNGGGAGTNQAPVVEITSPTDGQTVSGVLSITWTATDPDGDNMMYTIKYSDDSGATWNDLKVNLHSLVQLKYDWDTNFSSAYPDGDNYRIKVIASDDNGTAIASGEDETGDFTIQNGAGGGGDEEPADEEEDGGVPGFELAAVVAAVVAGAGFTSRRRKRR